MDYFVSQTAVHQIRYDKVGVLLDTSVPEFLKERAKSRCRKTVASAQLWEILVQNIKFYPWKKFGTHEEILRILEGIMKEICCEEMESAIELYEKRGILKTVNYLLSCVE